MGVGGGVAEGHLRVWVRVSGDVALEAAKVVDVDVDVDVQLAVAPAVPE